MFKMPFGNTRNIRDMTAYDVPETWGDMIDGYPQNAPEPVWAYFFTYKSKKEDTGGVYWVYRDYVIYVFDESHIDKVMLYMAVKEWGALYVLDKKGEIEIREMAAYAEYKKGDINANYTLYSRDDEDDR